MTAPRSTTRLKTRASSSAQRPSSLRHSSGTSTSWLAACRRCTLSTRNVVYRHRPPMPTIRSRPPSSPARSSPQGMASSDVPMMACKFTSKTNESCVTCKRVTSIGHFCNVTSLIAANATAHRRGATGSPAWPVSPLKTILKLSAAFRYKEISNYSRVDAKLSEKMAFPSTCVSWQRRKQTTTTDDDSKNSPETRGIAALNDRAKMTPLVFGWNLFHALDRRKVSNSRMIRRAQPRAGGALRYKCLAAVIDPAGPGSVKGTLARARVDCLFQSVLRWRAGHWSDSKLYLSSP
ncbi:UvrABC system protein B [Frankliniella fusca]|uniref:UvrABC system protein B n=1 Tax=Frankliniella fusca TaxID=407009 RepID=A0AAE1LCP4_9NEOP|nr:UvrABC system protein B [Frankliniella fusca]